MSTLTCHCGAEVEMSTVSLPDGWGRVVTFDQKLIPLCPSCLTQVKIYCEGIYRLTGNRYVSMSGLLR